MQIGSCYHITQSDTLRNVNRDTVTVYENGVRRTIEAIGPIRYARTCPNVFVETESRKKPGRFRLYASIAVPLLAAAFIWIIS